MTGEAAVRQGFVPMARFMSHARATKKKSIRDHLWDKEYVYIIIRVTNALCKS